MSSAPWRAILTAVAKAEGKTLQEWSDDCDAQAAALYASVPDYLRKPKLLPDARRTADPR